MGETRKLYIKSYGCQMNVYDAQRMADGLARDGFVETAEPGDADLIILNTCNIREKAVEKVYSELGRVRRIKQEAAREGRDVLVAVAGCVAQAEGNEIARRAPVVDIVVGPQSIHRLPELLSRAGNGKTVVDTEFPLDDKFDHLAPPSRDATRARGVTAFVTVQEGCDKFCTFCVVPYTRGVEVSRPVGKIVDEVERLAGAGVVEVTLHRSERQRLSWPRPERPQREPCGFARAHRGSAGDRAAALHHEPSARHVGRPDFCAPGSRRS